MSERAGSGRVRVVIVGGARFRHGVRARLTPPSRFEVAREVEDMGALASGPARVGVDVVIVDAAHVVDHGDPRGPPMPAPVVAVVDGEDATLARMVEWGARGFVSSDGAAVARVVRETARGGSVVDPRLGPRLLSILLQMNAERLDASVALELARESLTVQVRELLETNTILELARESHAAQLGELLETYRETVGALASAVELRDEYTGGHIERVAQYALAMAGELHPSLTDEPAVFGYMLHDIGKLAIPDAVLFNTGPLTDEQFELVKTHAVEGARLVEGIPFLRPALQIVRNHHERWDGAGYPDRLAGPEIPTVVRVFTLADALDAITTDRPYQAARSLDFAVEEIRAKAGTQFAPEVAAVFDAVVESDAAFDLLRRGLVPGSGRPVTSPIQ